MTDRLHEELMIEFRRYFEENQDWSSSHSHASGIRLRKHLYEIRRIALAMREEILEIRKAKPKVKSPKYREAQKRQKDQAQDTT